MHDRTEAVRELFHNVFGKLDPVDAFPERVFILQDVQGQVYQVKQAIKHPPDGKLEWDTWGIVCFSQEWIGAAFLTALNRTDLCPTEMSFDDARKLAKSKKVRCLFLLNNPDKIIVHWIA